MMSRPVDCSTFGIALPGLAGDFFEQHVVTALGSSGPGRDVPSVKQGRVQIPMGIVVLERHVVVDQTAGGHLEF